MGRAPRAAAAGAALSAAPEGLSRGWREGG
jgi:hypothetical protein